MTEHEQIRRVCHWNSTLARENARLRDELLRKHQECCDLSDANANLRVERDATDALLGAAMDEALKARRL